MLYEFQKGYNAIEATKNLYGVFREDAIKLELIKVALRYFFRIAFSLDWFYWRRLLNIKEPDLRFFERFTNAASLVFQMAGACGGRRGGWTAANAAGVGARSAPRGEEARAWPDRAGSEETVSHYLFKPSSLN